MRAKPMTRTLILILSVFVLSFSVSCTSVKEANPDQISIDTGEVGDIVPGFRSWISWFQANDHCVSQGKEAELADLKGSVAIYRCIAEK